MLGLISRASRQLRPEPPAVLSLRCGEITPPALDGIIDLLTVYQAPRKYWVGVINRLTQHQTPASLCKVRLHAGKRCCPSWCTVVGLYRAHH